MAQEEYFNEIIRSQKKRRHSTAQMETMTYDNFFVLLMVSKFWLKE
ncbi:hypothetical protein BN2497_10411 [Janthinobacterium sp. CG23_2]|nr:hypothetical protein BN2497_10411 [Janthinobacterium sp. CG23_2]CUU31603.1 hypothetical protein BN3177_10411 [Janthinobacterium sp. CG23_2]